MPDIKLSKVSGSNFKEILDNLSCSIDSLYFDDEAKLYFESYISSRCTDVYVEYPYYDIEYLSSVYSYYVKATKPVRRECYRLHFYIQDDYMGYIVLRPTPQMHIGRIQADPKLFLRKKAYLITQEYKSNILGEENIVKCFQFLKQDPEVAMCAQVATWAVVEHATRFNRNVISRKIAEITDMTWTFPERKIPAKGLTAQNIMEVLTSAGLFPIILGNTHSGIYKNEVLAYIESGIPVIGFIKNERHAVCLIGHGEVRKFTKESEFERFCVQNQELFKDKHGHILESNIILNNKFIDKVIVNDDNYAPYLEMPLDLELKGKDPNALGKVSGEKRISYTMAGMDGFVIPLSEKIYLSYQDVYKTASSYILSKRNDFPGSVVMRIYLAESAAFKAHALKNISDYNLSDTICKLSMSMYIWCVELSTPENYQRDMVDSIFVYDSTRHSKDTQPWILVQTLSQIEHFDGEKFSDPISVKVAPYSQYRCNLEGF